MAELSEGQVVDGRYTLVSRIGSGGMADVWLANDAHLGRQVALKVLHRRFAQDAEFVARFRREAASPILRQESESDIDSIELVQIFQSAKPDHGAGFFEHTTPPPVAIHIEIRVRLDRLPRPLHGVAPRRSRRRGPLPGEVLDDAAAG